MIDEKFVLLGAAIGLYGTLSYIIDTVKGKTKPNRVTWFLWALAPLIASYAQFKQGVGWPAFMTFIVGFSPLLVFIASFVNKKSEWKIGKFDIFCGALSVLGLVLWQITQIGNLAIFFGIMADGLAAVPTIVKSYKAPQTENYQAFFYAGINALITMATLKTWDFATAGFPIYIFSICLILFLLIKFKLGAKIQKRFA